MEHDKNLNGIDLHIHTTNSDGTRTPQETVRHARNEGLKAISITDHNQFSILKPETEQGMELIPGAEFSTSYPAGNEKQVEIHLIGLFFNGVNEKMQHIFDTLSRQRERYIQAILAQLNRLGIALSYQELLREYRSSRQIGRRHIAELMLNRGYVHTVEEAFDRYIGNYSPYLIEVTDYIQYMPLKACVGMICENEGFPILAHPYHYRFDDLGMERLVADFKAASNGHAAGIEVYYSKYNEEQRRLLRGLAKHYQLLPSAGSDSHGKEEPFSAAPYDLLAAMKQAMTNSASW